MEGVPKGIASPPPSGYRRPRAGLYARVSTDDQDGSLQLARLRQWAEASDYPIVWAEPETASGTNANRPKLQALMAEVRAHRVQIVAVCKVDRLARSVGDLAALAKEIRESRAGLEIIEQAISFPPGPPNPFTEALFNMLGVVAQLEVSMIRGRTRDALASKGKHGPWISRSGTLRNKLGRPPMITDEQLAGAIEEHAKGSSSWAEIALRRGWRPDSLRWAQRRRRPGNSQRVHTATTSARNEKPSRLDVSGGAL